MKSERTLSYIKSSKHAEGLCGGHLVYENDILEACTTPENGTLVDVVSPKGALSRHRFSLAAKQDPGAADFRNANDTFDDTFPGAAG